MKYLSTFFTFSNYSGNSGVGNWWGIAGEDFLERLIEYHLPVQPTLSVRPCAASLIVCIDFDHHRRKSMTGCHTTSAHVGGRTDLGRDPGGFGKDYVFFGFRMGPGLWARFPYYRCVLRRKIIGFIKCTTIPRSSTILYTVIR